MLTRIVDPTRRTRGAEPPTLLRLFSSVPRRKLPWNIRESSVGLSWMLHGYFEHLWDIHGTLNVHGKFHGLIYVHGHGRDFREQVSWDRPWNVVRKFHLNESLCIFTDLPWKSETPRVDHLHMLLYWPLPAFFSIPPTLNPCLPPGRSWTVLGCFTVGFRSRSLCRAPARLWNLWKFRDTSMEQTEKNTIIMLDVVRS